MRLTVSFLFLLLPASAAPEPSEHDFRRAMISDLPIEVDGELVIHSDCSRVAQVQCRAVRGNQRRFRCSYLYGANTPGRALIERTGDGEWRWISGARRCSFMTLGEALPP